MLPDNDDDESDITNWLMKNTGKIYSTRRVKLYINL